MGWLFVVQEEGNCDVLKKTLDLGSEELGLILPSLLDTMVLAIAA